MLIAALAWLLAGGTDGWARYKWQAPVDVATRRILTGRVMGLYPCLDPPSAQRDITAFHYFKDKANSIVDPELLARNRIAVRPLEEFTRSVQSIAETYLRSSPADASIAQCALDWLYEWADNDALLGEMSSRQAFYHRQWVTVGLAVPFLLIRDEPTLETAKLARVISWFHDLGDAIRLNLKTSDPQEIFDHRTNWSAAAAMLVAVISGDESNLTWAMTRYRTALQQIQPDGSLSSEMNRASKALYFHVFALSPLILMAETGARNGWNLYEQEDNALQRLVERVIQGLNDPSWFEQRTGIAQEQPTRHSNGSLAWSEVYYARFRDPRLVPWLTRFRPIRSALFGGDATLYYGAMPLPPAQP